MKTRCSNTFTWAVLKYVYAEPVRKKGVVTGRKSPWTVTEPPCNCSIQSSTARKSSQPCTSQSWLSTFDCVIAVCFWFYCCFVSFWSHSYEMHRKLQWGEISNPQLPSSREVFVFYLWGLDVALGQGELRIAVFLLLLVIFDLIMKGCIYPLTYP